MDARALLRDAAAKRAQTTIERIGDRWASYADRTLKCTACDVPIKHERLWAAHAASAEHARNAAAADAAHAPESPAAAQSAGSTGRAASDADGAPARTSATAASEAPKRKSDQEEREDTKRPRNEPDLDAAWAEFQQVIGEASTVSAPAPAASAVPAPAAPAAPLAAPAEDPRFANATISAEPALRDPAAETEKPGPGEPTPETEDELAARQARADKQDFLARLDEEERVQEEATDRCVYANSVHALKRRLARIRAQRT